MTIVIQVRKYMQENVKHRCLQCINEKNDADTLSSGMCLSVGDV